MKQLLLFVRLTILLDLLQTLQASKSVKRAIPSSKQTIITPLVPSISDDTSDKMATPLRQSIKCKCGKAQLDINSPSALRIVCYSQDYRGYYNTLNDRAKSKNQPANAKLDPWGGVDLTQIYVSI